MKEKEIDGILIREDPTVPEGDQVFWMKKFGKETILCAGQIGVPVRNVKFNMITLNPTDYEILIKSHERQLAREAPHALKKYART